VRDSSSGKTEKLPPRLSIEEANIRGELILVRVDPTQTSPTNQRAPAVPSVFTPAPPSIVADSTNPLAKTPLGQRLRSIIDEREARALATSTSSTGASRLASTLSPKGPTQAAPATPITTPSQVPTDVAHDKPVATSQTRPAPAKQQVEPKMSDDAPDLLFQRVLDWDTEVFPEPASSAKESGDKTTDEKTAGSANWKPLSVNEAAKRWRNFPPELRHEISPFSTLAECENATHLDLGYLFRAQRQNQQAREPIASWSLRKAVNEAIQLACKLASLIDTETGALPPLERLLSPDILPNLITALRLDSDVTQLGCAQKFQEFLLDCLEARQNAGELDGPDVILVDTAAAGTSRSSSDTFEPELRYRAEADVSFEQVAVASSLGGLVMGAFQGLLFTLARCAENYDEATNPLVALSSVASRLAESLGRPAIAVLTLTSTADSIDQGDSTTLDEIDTITRPHVLAAVLRLHAGLCGLRACIKLRARHQALQRETMSNDEGDQPSILSVTTAALRQEVERFGKLESAFKFIDQGSKVLVRAATNGVSGADSNALVSGTSPSSMLVQFLPSMARMCIELSEFERAAKLFSYLASAALIELRQLTPQLHNPDLKPEASKSQRSMWTAMHQAHLDEAKCYMNLRCPALAAAPLKRSDELYESPEFKDLVYDVLTNPTTKVPGALESRLTSLNILGTAYAMDSKHSEALVYWEKCASLAASYGLPQDPRLKNNIMACRQQLRR